MHFILKTINFYKRLHISFDKGNLIQMLKALY